MLTLQQALKSKTIWAILGMALINYFGDVLPQIIPMLDPSTQKVAELALTLIGIYGRVNPKQGA